RRLDLVIGAGVGGEADRGPVGAVCALVSVEVEDGYAADRDTRRVTGLGPAAAGDRVVLALHRDRVTVAHVLETEGRGGGDLGLGRGVVGEGCPDQVVVGSPGRPIGLTSEGAHVLKAEGWRVGDLGQVPRPCD